MAKDVLSVRQLEAQLVRREEKLEYLKKTGAPADAIRIAGKDVDLTRRRLERAKAADYDEEIETGQQIRSTEQ